VIPAVTHVDGTARVQTVERRLSPLYYEMIEEFDRRTGVPVVLNTSFNVKGEPIVCTPLEAVRCFFGTGLDALAIGNTLLLEAWRIRGGARPRKCHVIHAASQALAEHLTRTNQRREALGAGLGQALEAPASEPTALVAHEAPHLLSPRDVGEEPALAAHGDEA